MNVSWSEKINIMNIWWVLGGLVLLIVLGKLVPVWRCRIKNERTIREDFGVIQQAINAGKGQFEAINKFYFSTNETNLDNLIKSGKLFSRMAYLENKLKLKTCEGCR